LSSSIICVDENLIIRYINSTAEILFGNSASTLIGKEFKRLFSQVEASTITDKLPGFALQGQAMTEHDATIKLANGRSISVDYTIYALDDIGYILIEIKPIDHQAQYLRDEFSQLQKQASQQFARGMAHEIKNPLGGIRGAAQLLEKEITQAPLKEYTDVIISEVDRLQTLINNMLGPNTAIRKEPVNIHEILEHIRSLLLSAGADQFVIRRDYDPSIPELLADKDQLIQAFLNIAQNAVQALDTNGEIIFKTRIGRQVTIGKTTHPLVVLVDITDNGSGISAELSDTIFLPMVTDKPRGSGLGLPIAQEIVSGHGGIINAESSTLGTTFCTILPLEAA
ncbi:MAG: PAS domain-containing sensor histidine kinase, partial [Gammaproteobacteria bacterium]